MILFREKFYFTFNFFSGLWIHSLGSIFLPLGCVLLLSSWGLNSFSGPLPDQVRLFYIQLNQGPWLLWQWNSLKYYLVDF